MTWRRPLAAALVATLLLPAGVVLLAGRPALGKPPGGAATPLPRRHLALFLAPAPRATPTPPATAPPSLTSTPTATATPTPMSTPSPSPLPQGPQYAFVGRFAGQCSLLLAAVPELAQRRNLSCEAAATRMVLAGQGIAAGEDEILARMGRDADPHKGFRGNVDGYGRYADLRDYGTYAEVVARVLASYAVKAEVVYHLSDDGLRQALGSGRAIIVWMTSLANPRLIERGGYRLVEGEHVLVVVGLATDGRLLVHDPWAARAGSGAGTYLIRAVPRWDLFERMAVIMPS